MSTESVSKITRTRTRYDARIEDLMRRVGQWSGIDLNDAVTYCIALDKVWPPKGLDAATSNKILDLNYAFYRRLRDAIDRAEVVDPIGGKAIARMMLSEVYEGHDHERRLLKKLIKHFDEAARASTSMQAITATATPREVRRHAA